MNIAQIHSDFIVGQHYLKGKNPELRAEGTLSLATSDGRQVEWMTFLNSGVKRSRLKPKQMALLPNATRVLVQQHGNRAASHLQQAAKAVLYMSERWAIFNISRELAQLHVSSLQPMGRNGVRVGRGPQPVGRPAGPAEGLARSICLALRTRWMHELYLLATVMMMEDRASGLANNWLLAEPLEINLSLAHKFCLTAEAAGRATPSPHHKHSRQNYDYWVVLARTAC